MFREGGVLTPCSFMEKRLQWLWGAVDISQMDSSREGLLSSCPVCLPDTQGCVSTAHKWGAAGCRVCLVREAKPEALWENGCRPRKTGKVDCPVGTEAVVFMLG